MHRRTRRERTLFYHELSAICRVSYRYPWLVFIASFALCVPAWIQARNLGLDTDLRRLLPEDSAAVRWSDELEPVVGDGGYFSIILEEGAVTARRQVVEAIASRLRQLPTIESVDYSYPVDFLERFRYALIPAVHLEGMRDIVADWEEQVNPFLDDLGLSSDEDASEASADEDSDTIERMLQQYRSLPEYHEDPDSTMNGLILHASGGIANLGDVQEAYAVITDIVREESEPHGIRWSIGGSLRTRVEEFNVIERDLRVSGTVAIIAILVTLAVSFRSISILPVLVYPLAAGLLWAFAFVPQLVGDLNTITSFLLMVLFGAGIDYSIHLAKRFRHELVDKPVDVALHETFVSTGRSILTSGATTALGIGTLAISGFRGFSDFGIIGGLAIVFVTLSMLLVLPATLVVGTRLGMVTPRSPRLPSRLAIPPRWIVAALSTAAIVAAGASAYLLRFDYDFTNTSPSLEELEVIKEKEGEIYPLFFAPHAIYVAEDAIVMDEALELLRTSQSRQDTLIRSVSSVRDFAPATAEARRRLALIEEIQEMLAGRWVRRVEDPDRIRLIDDVRAFVPPSLEDMPNLRDVPELILDNFLARDGSAEFVLAVTSKGNAKDGIVTMGFTRELYDLEMPAGVRGPTGDKPVLAEVLWLVSTEGPLIVVLTFLGIFVLVILDRRDVQQATWVMVPLVASLLLTFGAMIVIGWKVNFFNMVVLPSLLGLGVDHGVHYYRRWRELGCHTAATQLELFEPISVATLTTVMGYAGMAFAHHPGLRSIGNLAIVGLSCTWVTALVLLPGLLGWRETHHSFDPEDADTPEGASAEASAEGDAEEDLAQP